MLFAKRLPKFSRERNLSELDKNMQKQGLVRLGGGGDTNEFNVHLLRRSDSPTLSQLYKKNCNKEKGTVSENCARLATTTYVKGHKFFVQHIMPDSNDMAFFFVESNHAPKQPKCSNAVERKEDCTFSTCTPEKFKNKKMILIPDGYKVNSKPVMEGNTETGVRKTSEGYYIGKKMEFHQTGNKNAGTAVLYLEAPGRSNYGCWGRFSSIETFMGTKCNFEQHRDLFSVADNCFGGASTLYEMKIEGDNVIFSPNQKIQGLYLKQKELQEKVEEVITKSLNMLVQFPVMMLRSQTSEK